MTTNAAKTVLLSACTTHNMQKAIGKIPESGRISEHLGTL